MDVDGCIRAQQINLSADALAKVKESANCKIFVNIISSFNSVDSYDPIQIVQKNHLFPLIGFLHDHAISIQQHCKSYAMDSVFIYFTIQTTMVCQAFASGTTFTNVSSYSVTKVEFLFEAWHNNIPEKVLLCIQQYAEHGEDVNCQSFQW